MGMPAKLEAMMLFNDGNSYMGQVAEVNLPKLKRKMEDWRGAGMSQAIKQDMGAEPLSMEWTCGGIMRGVLEQYGVTTASGVQLRFAGSYRADDAEDPIAVEVTVRGRHSEIDMGKQSPGDKTEFKVVTELAYYKLTMDGTDVIEIDALAMIEKVGGVDRQAKTRKAIGL
jgi:P2 family phage contractile tail tube protein